MCLALRRRVTLPSSNCTRHQRLRLNSIYMLNLLNLHYPFYLVSPTFSSVYWLHSRWGSFFDFNRGNFSSSLYANAFKLNFQSFFETTKLFRAIVSPPVYQSLPIKLDALSMTISVCLSVFLPVCPSIWLSACLSVYLSYCLSDCMFIRLSVGPRLVHVWPMFGPCLAHVWPWNHIFYA